MNTDNTVVDIFDTHIQAEQAVKDLQASGFDMKRLSIIGKGYHTEEKPLGFYTTGDRIKTWGGMGAFWGGLWGMLIGAAFFWVPGFGPIAAAGPVVHTLVSALEGAAVVGGFSALGAALTSLGVPKDAVLKYERELRADKYLLIANGDTEALQQARDTMARVKNTRQEAVAI